MQPIAATLGRRLRADRLPGGSCCLVVHYRAGECMRFFVLPTWFRYSSSGIFQSEIRTNHSDSGVFSNTLPIAESRRGMMLGS
jgi:hypothetical protein